MKNIFGAPFPYLDKLRNRLLHVFIILTFSILFLLIFEPFNIKSWLKYPGWLKSLGLISVGLSFSFIIAFSQLLLRSLIKIKSFKVCHLLVWFVTEMLLIALILTLLFADNSSGFLNELKITLKFTSTGLVLPYSFSILILILLHQKEKIKDPLSEASSDTSSLIKFKDEREQVKFSIQKSAILYLESSDNYVSIFYFSEGKIQKELVRNSMKNIEEQLSPYKLLRCHRSFIVNVDNVHSAKKDGRNYQIKIKNCDTNIPVSRGYLPEVKSRLLN